jgi:hypothetical protein
MKRTKSLDETVFEILGKVLEFKGQCAEIAFNYNAVPWEEILKTTLSRDYDSDPVELAERLYGQAGMTDEPNGDFLGATAIMKIAMIQIYCNKHDLQIPISFKRASFLNTDENTDCLEVAFDLHALPQDHFSTILANHAIPQLLENTNRPVVFGPYSEDSALLCQRFNRESMSFFIRPGLIKND